MDFRKIIPGIRRFFRMDDPPPPPAVVAAPVNRKQRRRRAAVDRERSRALERFDRIAHLLRPGCTPRRGVYDAVKRRLITPRQAALLGVDWGGPRPVY